jgi:tetratricopeptide (TPR) repeat protein
LGLIYYERNEPDKAVKLFKDTLTAVFTQPASGKLKQAVELAGNGKNNEAEEMLLSLLNDKDSAARAAYELGLIYVNIGNLDKAVTMFRNASTILMDDDVSYVGLKTCKTCHLKEYKSWKNTKMAQAFETLKPGVDAEMKTKLKFDPQKDYTKDSTCLECHTTGLGLPGGYTMPEAGDSKAAQSMQENEGVTCEGCHGPGSKYIAIHKNALTKKQKYTLDELYKAGQYKVNVKTCTTCHNSRNPTSGTGYHFDYEKFKAEDTHENFPLKYRAE